MKCPVCKDATLVMTERQGIEIDYCPECRGVWLDRGELDKVIERATTEQEADRRLERSEYDARREYGHSEAPKFTDRSRHGSSKHRKVKGILGELLDL